MLNKKINILFFAFFLLGWTSCADDSVSPQAAPLHPFFDIEDYFKKEITRIKDIKTVEKIAAINGEKEIKTLDNLDFTQELSIFTQSNINKTGWLDKYEIDSTFSAQQELLQLTYTAKEERLRMRKMIISFENKEVSKVEIKNATKNIIAQSEQNLLYLPKKGYTIHSNQDIVFSEPREMSVEVTFR